MSFSSNVKEELTRIVIKDENQRLAELVGFLITNCIVVREDKEFILKMATENEFAIRRVYTFLKTHYGIIAKSNVERPKIPGAVPLYHLKISNKTDLKTIFNESFINLNEKLQIVLNDKDIIIADDECQKAFLRGVFLGSGSVVNPDSRYHLEIEVSNQENALFINDTFCKLTRLIASYLSGETEIATRTLNSIQDFKYHMIMELTEEGNSRMMIS